MAILETKDLRKIYGSGYLLIYNVLYISISKDTRFYGLMKTLGTTQAQIKSLVKNQALKFQNFAPKKTKSVRALCLWKLL